LSDFNKGITYLLTYFQSRDAGIGNLSIPDPGIEKTVPGLQTLHVTLCIPIEWLLYNVFLCVKLSHAKWRRLHGARAHTFTDAWAPSVGEQKTRK